MGHALSIIVGIRHYNAMGIMVYYGIAYCISFIVGVWYVLTKTPKLGWNRTLRNGLAVSLVLGFILVTILGIPISE
jgi:prolipoprotein diacylglyceryltransferase